MHSSSSAHGASQLASHSDLKSYQREHRETFPPGLALRTHRALSWLLRAEAASEDLDGRFVFLWIAFNAAYSQQADRNSQFTETQRFQHFFEKICDLDRERLLYNLVWEQYASAIRLFLDNRYVYQPFWDYHNGLPESEDWEARFRKHKQAAHAALARGDTPRLLSVIFAGLYTLRNQIIHGGATWMSAVNRDQLSLGVSILERVVPTAIDLMMRNPRALWGDACYPVIEPRS